MAKFVGAHGRHGVQLLPGMKEVFLLIYADDIVLLSTTPTGLQCQIDSLYQASQRLSLQVNIDKTKVMVFRRGGFLGRGERWSLGGTDLEVVNEYKYLGYLFTTKLSLYSALDSLAVKAKKKTVQLLKAIWHLRTMNTAVFFRLYDAQIQPTLLYGSEIWGLEKRELVERTHMFACKRFLNVSVKTPSVMCSGELGRLPISISATIRAIKYWFRLQRMPVHRLPKQAYLMICRENENMSLNWAKSVEQTLSRLGFAYVWLKSGNVSEKSFVRSLKERLYDCAKQEWYMKVSESDRLAFYRSIKRNLQCESYLNFIKIKKFRDAFARFRVGNFALGANLHNPENDTDRECPFCREYEDERHFLIHCCKYGDLREKYLSKHLHDLTYIDMAHLMRGEDVQKTRDISMFLHYAFIVRFEKVNEQC